MDDITRLSSKETVILKLLIGECRELYGLEMVEQSNSGLKRGTIYVTLGRMEDKGLIKSRKEAPRPGSRGLPRRLYSPTGLGERTFAVWEFAAQKFGEVG